MAGGKIVPLRASVTPSREGASPNPADSGPARPYGPIPALGHLGVRPRDAARRRHASGDRPPAPDGTPTCPAPPGAAPRTVPAAQTSPRGARATGGGNARGAVQACPTLGEAVERGGRGGGGRLCVSKGGNAGRLRGAHGDRQTAYTPTARWRTACRGPHRLLRVSGVAGTGSGCDRAGRQGLAVTATAHHGRDLVGKGDRRL